MARRKAAAEVRRKSAARRTRKSAAAERARTMREIWRETMEMFRPPKMMSVSEWADENRVLTSDTSAEPGRWRTSRTPYQKDIMDSFVDPRVRKIVVMAGSQVGKTEMELNMMGRAIDLEPGPMLFVQPTDRMAEDFSKRRVATMINACRSLKRKVHEAKSRDAGNTIQMKTFPGGSVAFEGANSPAGLASRPIRYAFCDEVDRFPRSAGTEGDPLDLVEQRLKTFSDNSKFVITSTPTVKGLSRIEKAYGSGTKEEWNTQCPKCGEYSFITFGDIVFDKEEYTDEQGQIDYIVHSARWKCPHCGEEIPELAAKRCPGKWVAGNPDAAGRGVRSYRINAFSSPWSDWKAICYSFLRKKSDPEQLQVFMNTELGELWENRSLDTEEADELFKRREHYNAEVPDGVLVLTMGVDTQDNRLEYEVVGWSREEESWGIERGIIAGRPDAPGVWAEIDDLLDKEWKMKNGMALKISGTFIDSGGHFTQEVYHECAKRAPRRVWAIKGEPGDGRYLCRLMKKENGRDKAVRYIVGVDSGKAAIMYNVQIDTPGPRYMHFPIDPDKGYDIEYFKGLLSEKLVTHRSRGQMVQKWEQVYKRNEPLDIRNYARAVFKFTKWNFARIEEILSGTDEPEIRTRTEENARKNRHKVSGGIRV